MKTIAIIPARLKSTRLPNKMLLNIGDKPIIRHVFEQVQKARNINDVIIATDSNEIYSTCKCFTNSIVITSTEHQSGTDRIAEVATNLTCDFIINVQGDEPFINPNLIEQLSQQISNSDDVMVSVMSIIENIEDLHNPNIPKVIVDIDNYAIYFSRFPIPFMRDNNVLELASGKIPNDLIFYKHTGIYAYKKEFLLNLSKMKQTYLERQEKLEQLRVIENGYKIKMILTKYFSIGIDTKDDLEKAQIYYNTHNN